MTSSYPTNPELSQKVRDLIEKTFSAEEQPVASELVRSFHYSPGPAVDQRIHLDMIELAAGSLEKLRELAAHSLRDWRDLILAAEYDVMGEQIVQNERGKRRLEEFAERKKNGEFGPAKQSI